MTKATSLAAALLTLPFAAAAQGTAGSGASTCNPDYACTGSVCTVTLKFIKDEACTVRIDDGFVRKKKAHRITEATDLRINVQHANHLRYALKVDTKEVVVESYVHLERLWSQVLGLGAPTQLRAEGLVTDDESRFVEAVVKWRADLAAADAGVTAVIDQYPNLVLTGAEAVKIGQRADEALAEIQRLAERQATAARTIHRSENFAVYDGTATVHAAVVARLRSFVTQARLSQHGFVRRIEFGPAGRIVTATVSASERGSSALAKETLSVEFLVHSKLPVTFHAGYSVRKAEEFSFRSVAVDGVGDLFSRINAAKETGGLTAYMSLRTPWCGREHAAYKYSACPQLTLGTDFADVGKRLHVGVSFQFKRAFLTLGVVNLELTEGRDRVSDVLGAVGAVTRSEDLFASLSQARKWRFAGGLSFAPF